jgi:hypothetical protein
LLLVFMWLLNGCMMHLSWSIELLVCACTEKNSKKRRYFCGTKIWRQSHNICKLCCQCFPWPIKEITSPRLELWRIHNLTHWDNQNVLSCDKSTIESSKHSNWEQQNKSNCTKLWSFPNSNPKFSNLWHWNSQNVLSCDKSTIESSKHSNLE